MAKEIFTSTMPDELKGTAFQGNQMRDHKLACDEQIQNLIFGYLSLKKCSLHVYMKPKLKRKKPEKLTYPH